MGNYRQRSLTVIPGLGFATLITVTPELLGGTKNSHSSSYSGAIDFSNYTQMTCSACTYLNVPSLPPRSPCTSI